jgi:uncharacterized protein (TIGR03437 family)
MLAFQFGLLLQTLVGATYQPATAVMLAPGQVIPLMFTGLNTVSLPGVSITLHQSRPDRSWQLPIFAIEQFNTCFNAAAKDCLQTAITVQIPYDISVPNPLLMTMAPQGFSTLTLTLTENGVISQTFQVQPVYSRVHILQSCDIGGRTEGSGVCYALVAHADGSLVLQDVRAGGVAQTHSEARPGETLVMYAYGLGAVTTPVALGALSPIPAAVAADRFYLRYDYSPDAGSQPEFVGLTPGEIGLYQINFVVPALPAGTVPCGQTAQSNLNVSLIAASSGSFDSAAICVDPGTAAP